MSLEPSAAETAFSLAALWSALGWPLTRLLLAVPLPLEALRGRLEEGKEDAQLCADLALHGRKTLLIRQRQEAAQALESLDRCRYERLKSDVLQWQFFQ